MRPNYCYGLVRRDGAIPTSDQLSCTICRDVAINYVNRSCYLNSCHYTSDEHLKCYTYTCMVCICTHMCAHIHAYPGYIHTTHIHSVTHACTYVRTHVYSCTHTYTPHTCTHMYTHTRMHAHTCTHVHTHHTHVHTCTHTHTHTHVHTHAPTHAHRHTHCMLGVCV